MSAPGIYEDRSPMLVFGEDDENGMTVKMIADKSNKLDADYYILSKIGEGSFGEAFKVHS